MNYLQRLYGALKGCLSASNNLCGKLVPSLESPVILYESFKVTVAAFFYC